MFCREGGGATAVAGQRWAAARVVEREMRDGEDDKKKRKYGVFVLCGMAVTHKDGFVVYTLSFYLFSFLL